jgi:hypothetical protein
MNTTPYEKLKAMNPEYLDKEFMKACKSGDINAVKYMLTSSDLNYHPSINDEVLDWVCTYNKVDILHYILPFDKRTDIEERNDDLFYYANFNWSEDVLRYLIFDLNIPKTEKIEKHIKGHDDVAHKNLAEKIHSWFKMREWNKEVTSGLEPSKDNEKIKKIKI